jgi:hypothetical protein
MVGLSFKLGRLSMQLTLILAGCLQWHDPKKCPTLYDPDTALPSSRNHHDNLPYVSPRPATSHQSVTRRAQAGIWYQHLAAFPGKRFILPSRSSLSFILRLCLCIHLFAHIEQSVALSSRCRTPSIEPCFFKQGRCIRCFVHNSRMMHGWAACTCLPTPLRPRPQILTPLTAQSS